MNVTFQESILYYDCELIFEAADDVQRRYIAVHTGDYATGCQYIVALAAPESLAAFRNGDIDMRQLLLDSPAQEWYTAALDIGGGPIALRPMDTSIADCQDPRSWVLPETR